MTTDRPGSAEVIRAEVLAGVRHGFLGRRGGVSMGVVSGLNVGLGAIGGADGDSAEAVAENRRRAVAALYDGTVPAGARLVTVYQVHSPRCVVAGDWRDDDPAPLRPEADALVTDKPGVVLGILTADCAPVLLADVDAGVVGAAHAGWKGAFGGVCEATVDAMVALGAERARIVAAVGPCIGQASYEVDEAFRARFVAEDADHAGYFVGGRPGHWQFALEDFVWARLRAAGVARVEGLGLDTCALEARFFSYRRATLRGEAAYGRQIALIAL